MICICGHSEEEHFMKVGECHSCACCCFELDEGEIDESELKEEESEEEDV
jgi:hypothetical protein